MADIPMRHIILMIYTWVSVVVYCILLIIIIRNRKIFNGPFYTMVLWEFVSNICEVLTAEFLYRPRRFAYFGISWADAPMVFQNFLLFADSVFRSSMTLGYLIFALNRFTAFVFPLRHKFWTNTKVSISFIIIWICSVMIGFPMFFLSNTYTYKAFAIGGLNIICVSLCTILYAITIFHALKVKQGKNIHGLEKNVLFCSVVTFIPGVFEFIRSFLGIYRGNDTEDFNFVITDLWFFSAEIASTIQCWTLLFVNPSLREKLYKVVAPKEPIQSIRTIMNTKASERTSRFILNTQ